MLLSLLKLLTGYISTFRLINVTLLAYIHVTFKAERTLQIYLCIL